MTTFKTPLHSNSQNFDVFVMSTIPSTAGASAAIGPDAAAVSATTSATCEIDSQDVLRLILQFLKENNLAESMKLLQNESGVTLNTVDSIETFTADIRHGRWDSVLAQTANLKLPGEKLVSNTMLYINIYDLICMCFI